MRIKKKYGQHLLKEPAVAERIVKALSIYTDPHHSAYKTVLEIGPGQGVLTQFLITGNFNFYAVEIDPDMIGHLQQKFPTLKNLMLGDFLDLDLNKMFKEQFAIIGNFPYYISSQIVFKILDYKEMIPEMVGMFQMEVAKRICSQPGTKDYGGISVLIQAFYDTKYLFEVKPGSFIPPPNVQSAVIRLVRKKELPNCDEAIFKKVVKAAFGQRRKTLRNALKSIISDHQLLADKLFDRRAEQLSLSEFISLTNSLETHIRNDQKESPHNG